MSYVYRFESNDAGVYEAVEKDCPRSDLRRNLKPDGSWLPKVGTDFPGLTSYWTEYGLKKYLESGLQEWHRSVLTNPLIIITADKPKKADYEDEYQVICPKIANAKEVSWEKFVAEKAASKSKEKAVAYITRRVAHNVQVAVFEHDKEWSEAGLQVPAGTIDEGETPETAVVREAEEESGLKSLKVVRKIDEYQMYRHTHGEYNRRHVYELESTESPQEEWECVVAGGGEDKGMRFHYRWMNVEEAMYRLAGSLGSSLQKIL